MSPILQSNTDVCDCINDTSGGTEGQGGPCDKVDQDHKDDLNGPRGCLLSGSGRPPFRGAGRPLPREPRCLGGSLSLTPRDHHKDNQETYSREP